MKLYGQVELKIDGTNTLTFTPGVLDYSNAAGDVTLKIPVTKAFKVNDGTNDLLGVSDGFLDLSGGTPDLIDLKFKNDHIFRAGLLDIPGVSGTILSRYDFRKTGDAVVATISSRDFGGGVFLNELRLGDGKPTYAQINCYNDPGVKAANWYYDNTDNTMNFELYIDPWGGNPFKVGDGFIDLSGASTNDKYFKLAVASLGGVGDSVLRYTKDLGAGFGADSYSFLVEGTTNQEQAFGFTKDLGGVFGPAGTMLYTFGREDQTTFAGMSPRVRLMFQVTNTASGFPPSIYFDDAENRWMLTGRDAGLASDIPIFGMSVADGLNLVPLADGTQSGFIRLFDDTTIVSPTGFAGIGSDFAGSAIVLWVPDGAGGSKLSIAAALGPLGNGFLRLMDTVNQNNGGVSYLGDTGKFTFFGASGAPFNPDVDFAYLSDGLLDFSCATAGTTLKGKGGRTIWIKSGDVPCMQFSNNAADEGFTDSIAYLNAHPTSDGMRLGFTDSTTVVNGGVIRWNGIDQLWHIGGDSVADFLELGEDILRIGGGGNWIFSVEDGLLDLRKKLDGDSGTATGTQSSTTLQDTTKTWGENQWSGRNVHISGGTGEGQDRNVDSNTSDTLTISPDWDVTPDGTSTYDIGTAETSILKVEDGILDLSGMTGIARTIRFNGTDNIESVNDGSEFGTQQIFNLNSSALGSGWGAFEFRIGNRNIFAARNGIVRAFKVSGDSGTATGIQTPTTLQDTSKTWDENQWGGGNVRISGGTGEGQEKNVESNTSDTLTIDSDWDVTPDETSTYEIGTGQKIFDLSDGLLDTSGATAGTTIQPKATYGLGFNTTGAKVAADASVRTQLFVEQGGAGVRDKLFMCLKSDAGAYSWVQIADGGA